MLWSIVQVFGKQGITLVVFAILALVLKPTEFGIIAMAMTMISFIQVFSELGFGAALIQRRSITVKHINTIFYINVVTGLILTFLGILFSWPSAIFFKTQEVQPIIAILSLGFFINSLSLTQVAIAQREMKFRELAIRDVSASLIGGAIGIILAFLKFGVWSLVVQSLVTYTLGSIFIWKMLRWKPDFKEISVQCAKDLWPYSSRIFAFSIFKYFAQNTDKLLVGYFLGASSLGLYTFSFKVVVFPISLFAGAVGNYLFPSFSKIQKNIRAINEAYLFTLKSINSVVMPVLTCIVLSAPLLVSLVFGHKWISAIPLIQILTLLALTQSFISPIGQMMKALDHPGWLFKWAICITITSSALVWFGLLTQGLIGSAQGIILAYLLGLPINYIILYKLINISLTDLLKSLLPSTISSLMMGFVVWGTLNSDLFLSDYKLVSGMVLGVFIYILSLSLLDRSFLTVLFRKCSRASFREVRI